MKDNIKKSFWFNFLAVGVIFFVLYVLFFTSLNWITRHGEEIKIPDITGKDLSAAVSQLHEMHFEVYIDSAYEPNEKPLIVLKQVPDTGSIVKTGRTVFLTVNRAAPLEVPMPNLINLSFRSAEMLLHNNKLILGDTIMKPDIAQGAVLQQLYKGKGINPTDMIAQGSKIDLVIGNGLGVTEFNVPDVTGIPYDEGVTILNGSNLQTTAIPSGGMITDSATATIIDQFPRALNDAGAPNRIKAGDIVDLTIMQSASPDDIHHNTKAPDDVNNFK